MNTTNRSTEEPDDEQLLASLRQFIRTQGSGFLEDPDVSSIGVGRKLVDGEPTGEISIQFTVDQKAEPGALESLNTAPIPEAIVVEGVPVPTDVIERTYRPSFRAAPEAEAPMAKVRQDPVMPGVQPVTSGSAQALLVASSTTDARGHR